LATRERSVNFFLVCYWIAAVFALAMVAWGGPTGVWAVPALVLALPWNVALGVAATLGIVLVSLLLESLGMGRIDLASLSGEQQAAIFLYATTPFGVCINTMLIRRWGRPMAVREKGSGAESSP
jgi:hypothetical protein